MDAENLKQLLDACFTAKHVIETMPELPKGMKPRHIHVLDQISMAWEESGQCRISDVSEGLNITMPSITRLIQELETIEMLEKYPDTEDKRVTLLKLTEKGEICVKRHVKDFHREWAKNLSFVSNEQVQEAIRLIGLLEATMPGKRYGGMEEK